MSAVVQRADLVREIDGHAQTTSLLVAETFGKRHDNVLRVIDELLKEEGEALALNFEGKQTEVPISNGGKRQVRYFSMDRDGFMLLVMGFTGPKALQLKLAFIRAFNQMEAMLADQLATVRERPANDRAGPRAVDLEGALGTADDRHAIKTALLMVNTYKDLYGAQAGRDMMLKLGFPVPGVDLSPAPAPAGAPVAQAEGDLHQWCTSAGVSASRRDATNVGELFDSYSRWCSAHGVKVMPVKKFRDAMVMLFNHEEHPDWIKVVIARR